MIKITHFPKNEENLTPVLHGLHNKCFELTLEWLYSDENCLNMNIFVRSEEKENIESVICAFLSSMDFQYTLEADCMISDNNYTDFFVVSPNNNYNLKNNIENNLNIYSLFVLLTGLYKSKGKLVVKVSNYAGALNAAVLILTYGNYIPYEVQSALGNRFYLAKGSGIQWFPFIENIHNVLLTMPYIQTNSCSLVSGFGKKEQAKHVVNTEDVTLGNIFNDPIKRYLCFTKENWKSSTYVVGAPGYGKSTFINSLMTQAWKKQKVSFLVVEPKREYRCLKALIPEMVVLPSLIGFNPLLPPEKVSPFDYAEVVIQLINLCDTIPSESPLSGYYRETYYMAIRENNFQMDHFLNLYMKVMQQKNFVGQATNFIMSGYNRLENFFRIFCGPDFRKINAKRFPIHELLKVPTVIEIGKVSTQKILSVFTYFVISQMRLAIQLRESSNMIKNVLVVEEAHTVLSPFLPETLRTDVINLLAEGRAKGLSVVICDQSPNRLDKGATDLCGNNISFRLLSNADREYVSDQLECDTSELNNIRKQCCIVRTNSMYSWAKIKVEVDEEFLDLRPLSNNEIQEMNKKFLMNSRKEKEYS